MIELAQHIQTLLLENDCVIVPGLGGFIAHYSSASWDEQENIFLPPMRTLGFNPQLKMNDGVLVQSYMNVYDTHYSDANRRVQKTVDALCNQLYKDGKIELPNVGELRYTMRQTFEFTAFNDKIVTPHLYGFDSFEMKQISALKQPEPVVEAPLAPVSEPKREYHIDFTYLLNAAAMIAIVVLYICISVPVENTFVERGNYARLLPADLLGKIEDQSLVFTQLPSQHTRQMEKEAAAETHKLAVTKEDAVDATDSVATIQPESTPEASAAPTKVITTSVEVAAAPAKPVTTPAKDAVVSTKAAPAPVKTVDAPVKATPAPVKSNKDYHVIVAGGVQQKNAENLVARLKGEGFADARVLNCNGIIRVSISAYSTAAEATAQLTQVRAKSEFKDAWMLANK